MPFDEVMTRLCKVLAAIVCDEDLEVTRATTLDGNLSFDELDWTELIEELAYVFRLPGVTLPELLTLNTQAALTVGDVARYVHARKPIVRTLHA